MHSAKWLQKISVLEVLGQGTGGRFCFLDSLSKLNFAKEVRVVGKMALSTCSRRYLNSLSVLLVSEY